MSLERWAMSPRASVQVTTRGPSAASAASPIAATRIQRATRDLRLRVDGAVVRSALGTAFAGAALSVSLALTLPAALTSAGITGDVADQLAETTRLSAGTTITQLRAQGSGSALGDQTAATIDALSSGFADGTRWALVIATSFLILGLVGALRLAADDRRRASAALSV